MPPYIILQLIFFVTELSLLILRRSKQSTEKNQRDRRSLLILWVTIAGGSFLGPWAAAYQVWVFNGVTIGVIIFAIGFIIRWAAVYQLGKMFTVDVAIADGHILNTNGLYKIVRHPSYLGLILIIAGLSVVLNSALSLIIMLVPALTAISYRISVEERALIEAFGDQYIDYQSRVKKLIPGIY